MPIRWLGYGDHPSSGLSSSMSWTTYQLLPWWQMSRRVPSPIFTRQLSHTRPPPAPTIASRASDLREGEDPAVVPFDTPRHVLPSGRHSTRAVTSLIDFSPRCPLFLFTNERVFYYHTTNRADAGHLQDVALRAEVSPDGTKRPRVRAPTVGF